MSLFLQFYSIIWLIYVFHALKTKLTPDSIEKKLTNLASYSKLKELIRENKEKSTLYATLVIFFLLTLIDISINIVGYYFVYNYIEVTSAQWSLYLVSIVLFWMLFLRREIKIIVMLYKMNKGSFDERYFETEEPLGIKFLDIIATLSIFYFTVRLTVAVFS